MNRRELIRMGALSAAVVPASGCATLWELFGRFVQAPKLAIREMEVTKMTLSTMSVKFLASLSNPNPLGFKLFGLDYLLRVSGQELAKGRAPQGIELRPRGTAKTEFEMDFGLGRSAAAILELIEKRSVPYELSAVGKFLSKKGGVDVPVGFSGKLPMPNLPQVNVKTFRPLGVSGSGVSFRLDTEVKNPNDFEIPIDGFSFDLKLDGRSVLRNKGAKGVRVAANRREVVPLEFRVGLRDLGMSLSEVARGARMPWELSTEIKSGKLVVPFTDKGRIQLK